MHNCTFSGYSDSSKETPKWQNPWAFSEQWSSNGDNSYPGSTALCEQATLLPLKCLSFGGIVNNTKVKQWHLPHLCGCWGGLVHFGVKLARDKSIYQAESHFPVSVIKMLSPHRMFSKKVILFSVKLNWIPVHQHKYWKTRFIFCPSWQRHLDLRWWCCYVSSFK